MKHLFKISALTSVLLVFTALTHSQTKNQSLKEAFGDYFHIGTALNHKQIRQQDHQALQLVKKHFNSITPENVMKWEQIHPEPNAWQFNMPDNFVHIGERHDMFTIGHTLVWHSQLPDWVTSGKDGDSLASQKTLISRIKRHISKVAGKYRGKIDGWDVVNEALNDDGSYRESGLYQIAGRDYIVKAFKFANRAAPGAELYYNDYNLWKTAKREGAIDLVKFLKSRDIQVDAIGMQGHWGLDYPSLDQIETSIKEFSELGIDVMITELDISVLKNPWDVQGADVGQSSEGKGPDMNPYPNSLPDSMQTKLAKRYKEIFKLFLKHKDKISRVAFWGVHDGQSWLNNWPIKGRTNYPLLFNRNYNPKPAYDSVMSLVNDK